MNYIEYEKDTGLILEIHREYPTTIRENCLVIQNDNLQIGMESSYDIVIGHILDDNRPVFNFTLKPEITNFHVSERLANLENEKHVLQTQLNDTKNSNTQLQAYVENMSQVVDLLLIITAQSGTDSSAVNEALNLLKGGGV